MNLETFKTEHWSALESLNQCTFDPVFGYKGSKDPARLPADLVELVAYFSHEIEDDRDHGCGAVYEEWTALAKLKDGRYVRMTYWMNGCGSQGHEGGEIAETLEQLLHLACTLEERSKYRGMQQIKLVGE